jgi:hypothetical protein
MYRVFASSQLTSGHLKSAPAGKSLGKSFRLK